MVGRTLAHYLILEPIGAGGMGEGYRARDSRFDREIAIKLLPVAFANDPNRLLRFEREARAVGSLLKLHTAWARLTPKRSPIAT